MPEPTLTDFADAITTLLAQRETHEVVVPGGKKELRERHPTDPPHGYTPVGRRAPDPGPLPTLVRAEDVAPDARVLEHEHRLTPPVIPDHVAHLARLVVIEARRVRARSVALRTLRADALVVVLVL